MTNPISRSPACACGISDRDLYGRYWRRQYRGVYTPIDDEAEDATYRAALEAVGHQAALSHFSAAAVWQLPLPIGRHGDDPVHLTVRITSRPRHRNGIRVHENRLDAGEVCEIARLRLTTVPRTWFDLAAVCDFSDLVAITDAILHKGLAMPPELGRAIQSCRRGAKNARRSMIAADGRAESPWETRLRLILHAVGIMVVPQVVILDRFDNVIARTDLALEELKIAIEYDGAHHLDRDQQRRDLDRVRAMERAGWLVLRFGVEDIRNRQNEMIAEIQTAIRQRRASQSLELDVIDADTP